MRAAAVPLVAAALVLGAAACGADEDAGAGDEGVTVQLAEQNGSGQAGTATLSAEGDEATRVVLELEEGTADPQPAHIHAGTCTDLDPQPKYPLDGLVDGRSETTVQTSLEDLTAGQLAINVHKSEAEVETYVACGDIGDGGEPAEPASTERDYGY